MAMGWKGEKERWEKRVERQAHLFSFSPSSVWCELTSSPPHHSLWFIWEQTLFHRIERSLLNRQANTGSRWKLLITRKIDLFVFNMCFEKRVREGTQKSGSYQRSIREETERQSKPRASISHSDTPSFRSFPLLISIILFTPYSPSPVVAALVALYSVNKEPDQIHHFTFFLRYILAWFAADLIWTVDWEDKRKKGHGMLLTFWQTARKKEEEKRTLTGHRTAVAKRIAKVLLLLEARELCGSE